MRRYEVIWGNVIALGVMAIGVYLAPSEFRWLAYVLAGGIYFHKEGP